MDILFYKTFHNKVIRDQIFYQIRKTTIQHKEYRQYHIKNRISFGRIVSLGWYLKRKEITLLKDRLLNDTQDNGLIIKSSCIEKLLRGYKQESDSELIKLIYEKRKQQMNNYDLIFYSSLYGNLVALEIFTHFYQIKTISKYSVNIAIDKNNLEIVKWLLDNRSEGCNINNLINYLNDRHNIQSYGGEECYELFQYLIIEKEIFSGRKDSFLNLYGFSRFNKETIEYVINQGWLNFDIGELVELCEEYIGVERNRGDTIESYQEFKNQPHWMNHFFTDPNYICSLDSSLNPTYCFNKIDGKDSGDIQYIAYLYLTYTGKDYNDFASLFSRPSVNKHAIVKHVTRNIFENYRPRFGGNTKHNDNIKLMVSNNDTHLLFVHLKFMIIHHDIVVKDGEDFLKWWKVDFHLEKFSFNQILEIIQLFKNKSPTYEKYYQDRLSDFEIYEIVESVDFEDFKRHFEISPEEYLNYYLGKLLKKLKEHGEIECLKPFSNIIQLSEIYGNLNYDTSNCFKLFKRYHVGSMYSNLNSFKTMVDLSNSNETVAGLCDSNETTGIGFFKFDNFENMVGNDEYVLSILDLILKIKVSYLSSFHFKPLLFNDLMTSIYNSIKTDENTIKSINTLYEFYMNDSDLSIVWSRYFNNWISLRIYSKQSNTRFVNIMSNNFKTQLTDGVLLKLLNHSKVVISDDDEDDEDMEHTNKKQKTTNEQVVEPLQPIIVNVIKDDPQLRFNNMNAEELIEIGEIGRGIEFYKKEEAILRPPNNLIIRPLKLIIQLRVLKEIIKYKEIEQVIQLLNFMNTSLPYYCNQIIKLILVHNRMDLFNHYLSIAPLEFNYNDPLSIPIGFLLKQVNPDFFYPYLTRNDLKMFKFILESYINCHLIIRQHSEKHLHSLIFTLYKYSSVNIELATYNNKVENGSIYQDSYSHLKCIEISEYLLSSFPQYLNSPPYILEEYQHEKVTIIGKRNRLDFGQEFKFFSNSHGHDHYNYHDDSDSENEFDENDYI